jgi:uncharacterized membrane protein
MLEKIPFVKSIYGAIRDTLEFLFGGKESFSTTVLLDVPHTDYKVLGFVTNRDPGAKTGADMGDRIGVYVPMAFNVGGYTFFVPPDKIEEVNLPVEEAMMFALSGGVARGKEREAAPLLGKGKEKGER